jgi:hypothetical protein
METVDGVLQAHRIPTTPTFLCFPSLNKNYRASSWPPPETLSESVRIRWHLEVCNRPQATSWLRRFGVIFGNAPCTLREAPTCDPFLFVPPCSRHSKTPNHPRTGNEL